MIPENHSNDTLFRTPLKPEGSTPDAANPAMKPRFQCESHRRAAGDPEILAYTSMRIAVTGAFGYSGRYITKRPLEAGHEVITLTNSMHCPNPFGERVAAFPFS